MKRNLILSSLLLLSAWFGAVITASAQQERFALPERPTITTTHRALDKGVPTDPRIGSDSGTQRSGTCTPDMLIVLGDGCGPDGLPRVLFNFYINGECIVGSLCYTVNGGPLNCQFLGFEYNIGDGGSLTLTGLEINSTYVFHFTTEGGQSSPTTYTTGDCAPDPCVPEGITATFNGCTEDGSGGWLSNILLTFDIDGICRVEDLCWTVNGGGQECINLPDLGYIVNNGGTYAFNNALLEAEYTFSFTTEAGSPQSTMYTTGNCENADCVPITMALSDGTCLTTQGQLLPTINMLFDIDGTCPVQMVCYSVNGGELICQDLAELGIEITDGETLQLQYCVPLATYEIYYITAGGVSSTYTYHTPECFDCFAEGLTIWHNTCLSTELEIINIRFNIDGDCYAQDLCWTFNNGEEECFDLPDFMIFAYDGHVEEYGNWNGPGTYRFYFTTEAGPSNTYVYNAVNCNPDNAMAEHIGLSVAVHPNPASDRVTITMDKPGAFELELIDGTGRTVLQHTFSGTTYVLELDALATGVYTLVIGNEHGRTTQRILKH